MGVGTGEGPAVTGEGRAVTGERRGPAARHVRRRETVRGLLAALAALVGAPLLGASRAGPARGAEPGAPDVWPPHMGSSHMGASHMDASHMGSSHMGAGEHGGVLPEGPERAVPFEETYRGRRLRGGPVRDAAGRSTDEGAWEITVDGRPLHLMRRADGTWLSMVDHYTSHPTPLGATRAAVDELGPGRRLRDLMSGPAGHRHGTPDTGGTAATGTGMTNGMGADSGVRT